MTNNRESYQYNVSSEFIKDGGPAISEIFTKYFKKSGKQRNGQNHGLHN